ncbi:MAG: hypothetical protein ABIH23_00985 [bacterium]
MRENHSSSIKYLSTIITNLVSVRFALCLTLVSVALLTARFCDLRTRGLVRTMTPILDGRAGEQKTFRDLTVNLINWDLRRDCPDTREIRVRWDGFLWVEKTDYQDLIIFNDGELFLEIDEKTVLYHPSGWEYSPNKVRLPLTRGAHAISIRYSDQAGHSAVSFCQTNGASPKPYPSHYLSPTPITPGRIIFRRVSDILWPITHIILAGTTILWTVLLIRKYRRKGIYFTERSFWIAVAFLFAIGLGLRLYLAAKSNWSILADEAVVGILGQRIAEAKSFPLMYPGQHYGGPLEAYLMALVFLICGASQTTLRLTPLLLSALGIPLFAWAAKESFGKRAGFIVSALWTIPPVMTLVYSLMAMVGPIENALIAALTIGFWAKASRPKGSISRHFVFLVGLLLGVGLWVNTQMLYILLPLSILLLTPLNRQRSVIFVTLFFAGLAAGALPLIIYNYTYPLATLRFLTSSDNQGNLISNFIHEFLEEAWPVLMGQGITWRPTESLSLWPLNYGPALIALAAGFYVLIKMSLWIVKRRSVESSREYCVAFLPALSLVFGIIVFSASNLPGKAPRHIFLLVPVYLFLLGWTISALSRRLPLIASIVLTLQIFWNIQGLSQADARYYFQPIHLAARGQFIPSDLTGLSKMLIQSNADSVYTDYWIGENLAFNLIERIPVFSTAYRRVDQAHAAMQGTLPAYLFHINEPDQPVYGDFLSELGWSREDVLPFLLYMPERHLAAPKVTWEYATPSNDTNVYYACDGVLETVWIPQPSDDWVEIILPDNTSVQRVGIISGPIQGAGAFSISVPIEMIQGKKVKNMREQTLTIITLSPVEMKTLRISIPKSNKDSPLRIHEIFLL